jgi:hypothetical protein
MDESEQALQAYDQLYNSIPSIGFLSRKKRISAYLKVTEETQNMIDNGAITEDQALFLLSILVRKCSKFQKSAMMAALNLASINNKNLQPIAFKYANDYRCSLNMLPVDELK